MYVAAFFLALFAALAAAGMVRDGYNHWYFYLFLFSAVTAFWFYREGRANDKKESE